MSLDSLEYIDESKINGCNLYAYCGNDPINNFDPSGHSAILIGLIIGAVIGAAAGFGAAAYVDYTDDGEVFNGSVAWYDYLGATVLGAGVGAALGAGIGYIAPQIASAISSFSGMSFSTTLNIYGWMNKGGALVYGVAKTMTLTVTGAQILTAAGAGAIYMFAKTSRRSGKDKSNDKPSWVNSSMVDKNKSPHQNATDILNAKYGEGNWIKGPKSEFSQILKWIIRDVLFYSK
jgi:hypothetical protein